MNEFLTRAHIPLHQNGERPLLVDNPLLLPEHHLGHGHVPHWDHLVSLHHLRPLVQHGQGGHDPSQEPVSKHPSAVVTTD